ncbi:MAG: Hsp20/alpha crystallin family protein [Acidimicrobiales bacterium]
MGVDAVRDEHQIILYFDVPGVRAEYLDLSIERNELTIRAERRWSDSGRQVLVNERPQGTFVRQLMLNDAFDTGRLEAHLEDGVLVVTIPVDESSKARKVQIQSAGGRSAIDASSTEPGRDSGRDAMADSAAGTNGGAQSQSGQSGQSSQA